MKAISYGLGWLDILVGFRFCYNHLCPDCRSWACPNLDRVL